MASTRWISAGLLAMAAVAGAAWWLQRQAAADLRDEIALLNGDKGEMARLRAENQRLAAELPPAERMTELRADRAAVLRLRAEIGRTSEALEKRERALQDEVKTAGNAPSREPALTLQLGVGPDGKVSSNGSPVDVASLRQQLAGLPRGSQFELRLRLPPPAGGVNSEAMQRGIEVLSQAGKEIAQERGLRMSVRMEKPDRP